MHIPNINDRIAESATRQADSRMSALFDPIFTQVNRCALGATITYASIVDGKKVEVEVNIDTAIRSICKELIKREATVLANQIMDRLVHHVMSCKESQKLVDGETV